MTLPSKGRTRPRVYVEELGPFKTVDNRYPLRLEIALSFFLSTVVRSLSLSLYFSTYVCLRFSVYLSL